MKSRQPSCLLPTSRDFRPVCLGCGTTIQTTRPEIHICQDCRGIGYRKIARVLPGYRPTLPLEVYLFFGELEVVEPYQGYWPAKPGRWISSDDIGEVIRPILERDKREVERKHKLKPGSL